MFERYTERARRALFFARYEATQLGGEAIETEHLLLGITREGQGVTGRVLAHHGLSLETVREEVAARTSTRSPQPALVEIPFSDETKAALLAGAGEATGIASPHIGPEHLLLGLLGQHGSTAAAILTGRGVTLDALRREVAEETATDRIAEQAADADFHAAPLVRISPSQLRLQDGTNSDSGPGSWHRRGFDLKQIIADICGVAETHIDWPADLDDAATYDVEARAPKDGEAVDRLVLDAIARHFGITITRETRTEDVYVLTVADGPAPNRRLVHESGGGGIFAMSHAPQSREPHDESPELGSRREVWRRLAGVPLASLSGTLDMHALCEALAQSLGRPFVDETGLTGSYEIQVSEDGTRLSDFFQALRDQAGLIVTPGKRDITMIVVRPA